MPCVEEVWVLPTQAPQGSRRGHLGREEFHGITKGSGSSVPVTERHPVKREYVRVESIPSLPPQTHFPLRLVPPVKLPLPGDLLSHLGDTCHKQNLSPTPAPRNRGDRERT